MNFRWENNTGLSRSFFQEILGITDYYSEIYQVRLYGKRIFGVSKRSKVPVELAIYGDFDSKIISNIKERLTGRPFNQSFELVHFEELKDFKLKEQIERNSVDISGYLDSWANTRFHQAGFSPVKQHGTLPVYTTDEFNVYRCVQFTDSLYGKTVSELHEGNLRRNTNQDNRYSSFLNKYKLSYWADSPYAAREEVKKGGATNNLLTFWGYDDGASSFPTIDPRNPITLVDGLEIGFHELLLKIENQSPLSADDENLIAAIEEQSPDCLIYKSATTLGARNFMFFEKEFKKIALREVRLRLGDRRVANSGLIICAGTSDYSARLEEYGKYFERFARVKMDKKYLNSEEFKMRKKINDSYYKEYFSAVSKYEK